jgi:predicted dehydrogenase
LGLDGVYVTTPISSHSSIVKNVYKNGIARYLFVEKTLASNYAEANELCRLVQNEGVNMVGYMKRFSVTFRRAKDLLSQETLKGVSSFKAYAYSSDFMGDSRASRTSAARGGALRDLGCHVIDLALWFFGEFRVESVADRTSAENGANNSVSFKVKRSDGLEGEFDISQCKRDYRMPEVGLLIRGSNGTLEVNDDKLRLQESTSGKSTTWYRHDLNDSVDFWLGEPEYSREDQHFIRSILTHQKSAPDFLTGSKVDLVIDQVKQSYGSDSNE